MTVDLSMYTGERKPAVNSRNSNASSCMSVFSDERDLHRQADTLTRLFCVPLLFPAFPSSFRAVSSGACAPGRDATRWYLQS